jgi:hypothetical protein
MRAMLGLEAWPIHPSLFVLELWHFATSRLSDPIETASELGTLASRQGFPNASSQNLAAFCNLSFI